MTRSQSVATLQVNMPQQIHGVPIRVCIPLEGHRDSQRFDSIDNLAPPPKRIGGIKFAAIWPGESHSNLTRRVSRQVDEPDAFVAEKVVGIERQVVRVGESAR